MSVKPSRKSASSANRHCAVAVNTGISLNTIHETRSSPLYPIEVDHSIDGNSTPLPSPTDTDDEETNQIASDSNTIDRGDRPHDTACGPSDVWEVLSNSGASLLSPDKRPALANSGSVSSWKSARNGECLGDFGGECSSSLNIKSRDDSDISRRCKYWTVSQHQLFHAVLGLQGDITLSARIPPSPSANHIHDVANGRPTRSS